jgi:hypothetical protein
MSERVIATARKLAACVLREREVKAGINWHECEHYEEGEPAVGYPGTEPCPFRDYKPQNLHEANDPFFCGTTPRDQWCSRCETNWTLRGEWGELRRKRSAHIRALVNAVQKEERP